MLIVVIFGVFLTSTIGATQAEYIILPQKVVATWEEAKQRCENTGAVLASPIDTELLNEITTRIKVRNHSNFYFLGTRATHYKGPFVSIEGISLEDMPTAVMDMIEQIDPLDGECLSIDGSTIRVVPCTSRLPYICYLNATVCDGDYELDSSKKTCYKYHPKGLIWDKAKTTCEAEGGYLAVVNDEQESLSIKSMNVSVPEGMNFLWIGLRDHGNGNWTSVHVASYDTHGMRCGGDLPFLPLARHHKIFMTTRNKDDSEKLQNDLNRLWDPVENLFNKWAYYDHTPAEDLFKCAVIDPATGLLKIIMCNIISLPFLCEKELSSSK